MKKLFLSMVIMIFATLVFAEKNLAVATFDISNNAVTKDEAEAITELYIAELVGTGKVSVVDRTNFDKILKEMNFQNSDWSDNNKTIEVGNAVNAELIARGQVIKLGSKMYLTATIIDVKTANVLSSARKQFESLDDIFGLLTSFANDAIAGLTLKIGDTGPAGGIVFYIEGQNVYECVTTLGTASWSSAKEMASKYNGGGYEDWHLPTIGELRLMYSNLYRNGLMSTYGEFWSSSYEVDYKDRTCPIYKNFYSDSSSEHGFYDYAYNQYIVSAVRVFKQE